MELFFIGLLISFPIFYLLGLIDFLKTIFGRKDKRPLSSPSSLREEVIAELEKRVKTNPKQTVSSLLKDYYQERLGIAPPQTSVNTTIPESIGQQAQELKTLTLHEEIKQIPHNWYSENSILLLLYVGAFLIVASASIFVSFQWGSYSGISKALVLSFTALAFMISGLFIYKQPKITQAGFTFTGVGALLIPFCTIAWYNFVFKPLGLPFSSVWLFSSVISTGLYVFLSLTFKSKFYTYISSLGVLSFFLASSQALGLDNQYFILSALLSSYSLLIIRKILLKNSQFSTDTYSQPVLITANITAPTALFFGLITALSTGSFISLTTGIGLLLGSGFYLLSYLFESNYAYLFIGQSLIPLGVYVLFSHLHASSIITSYALSMFSLLFFAIGDYFHRLKADQEFRYQNYLSFGLLAVVSFFSWLNISNPLHGQILLLIPFTLSFLALRRYKLGAFLYVASFLIPFIVHRALVPQGFISSTYPQMLIMLLVSTVFYLYAVKYKDDSNFVSPLAVSFFWSLLASYFFSFNSQLSFAIVSIFYASIATHAAYKLNQSKLIYLTIALLDLSLLLLLSEYSVKPQYYPIVVSIFSIITFCFGMVKSKFAKQIRYAAIATSMVAYFIPVPIISTSPQFYLPLTALISTILTSLEAVSTQNSRLGYVASAIGVFTLLNVFHFHRITESQVYTVTLSVYLLVLAYLRKRKNDFTNQNLLDLAGVFILLFPTWIQSTGYGPKALVYSLLLGVYGLVLFLLGMSLVRKHYTYSGIAAIVIFVLSRTYQYILSLPRWAVTALFGIGFLVLATYLLSRRKETH